MTDAPIDLKMRRRAILQKRLDRACHALASAEADARDYAESVAELRAFAEAKGAESDEGRDALAFAERMEREDAALVAALRENVQTAQAELDRLDGRTKK